MRPSNRVPPTANLAAFILAVLLAGCASTDRTSPGELRADTDNVLLTSSGALELHVRDGKVLEIEPATENRETARVRQIRTLDELRATWEQVSGEPLTTATPGGPVSVNGWVGLECVRLGQACGRPPDDAPRVLVVIRFD